MKLFKVEMPKKKLNTIPENRAQIQFDEYENQVFEKVKKIIKNE